MMDSQLPLPPVPENVAFAQAIALTQEFVERLEREPPPADVERFVSDSIGTIEGARGFFVGYLTSDRPCADRDNPDIARALAAGPDFAIELLVKNVAMSAAAAVGHRRKNDGETARLSDRTCGRSLRLLRAIDRPLALELARAMVASARNGTGSYGDFLQRWNYDEAQKQAIVAAFTALLPEP